MKVIKSIFKFIAALICIAIIVGIHGVLFYLNYKFETLEEINVVLTLNCIFCLIIYIKFKKLKMIFAIFGYWITTAFLAALHYFPLKFIINRVNDNTVDTVLCILAAISFLWFLWLYVISPMIDYIKRGGDIRISHYNSNPYTYGTAEHELREFNNKLDEIKRNR